MTFGNLVFESKTTKNVTRATKQINIDFGLRPTQTFSPNQRIPDVQKMATMSFNVCIKDRKDFYGMKVLGIVGDFNEFLRIFKDILKYVLN